MAFAIVVALSFTLPITAYVAEKHATIAPLHILSGCCGWEWTPNQALPNNIPSDVTDFVLPDRFVVKQAFSAGQIALWNPSYFGGEVFFANLQSTVLHPVNILYLFMSEMNAQTASVVISLFLLSMSMVLMLLQLGRSRSASAVGGISLAGSTFAMFWSTFGMMTWMMAAMPASIYLFLKWRQSANNKWLAALSILLGAQLYFGHIQFSFMVFVVIGLFALYNFLFSPEPERRIKNWVLAAVAMLAGALIGMAQLLPFLQQAKIGHRAGVILTTSPATWSYRLYDIKNFFKPYLFGPFGKTGQYFFDYGPFRFSIGLLSGILVLAAIVKLIRSPRRYQDETFFFILLLVGMFWMWGSGPQQILDHLVSTFKSLNPAYFMALPLFAASALAAYGYDSLFNLAVRFDVRGKVHRRRILAGVLALSLIAALIYPALAYRQWRLYINDINYGHLYAIGGLYVLSTVCLLILCLGATSLFDSTKVRSFFRALPFIFVLANALLIFRMTAPVDPKTLYYNGNPYFDRIIADSGTKNPADVRIISPYSPQTNLYYRLSTLNGYDSLYAKSTENLIDAINYPNPTFELSAGPHGSHNAIYIGNISKTELLQNLGVSYVISDKSVPGYKPIDQTAGDKYTLYKSNRSAPQIYFATKSTRLSLSQQLQAVRKNGLAYHEIAAAGLPTDSYTGGQVDYDLVVNKINVSTISSSSQVLFIGQTYRPQWKAYIDGQRVNIYQADYNFMALKVPAGSHHISMVYDPESFKIGVAVSVLALVSVIGYTILSRTGTGSRSDQPHIKELHSSTSHKPNAKKSHR